MYEPYDLLKEKKTVHTREYTKSSQSTQYIHLFLQTDDHLHKLVLYMQKIKKIINLKQISNAFNHKQRHDVPHMRLYINQ